MLVLWETLNTLTFLPEYTNIFGFFFAMPIPNYAGYPLGLIIELPTGVKRRATFASPSDGGLNWNRHQHVHPRHRSFTRQRSDSA